jgi:hypothetical protein
MTRIPLSRRGKVAPEPAAALAPSSSAAEFQAECEALSAAVTENLGAVSRGGVTSPARKPAADAFSPGPAPRAPVRSHSTSVHYLEDMEFVPAYSTIMRDAGVDLKDHSGTEQVTVPRQLWDFVLRCMLDRVEFDEQQYLKCNPDVAAAVKDKQVPSGREHFIKVGYFEGRSGGVPVDEAWYLARNPDVVTAMRAGKIASGAEQYRLAGASEWRAPNPQLEGAVAMWKSVLDSD